uniref:Uncharacterized protein n=1 Tax=Oryza brachyantha TaxID=4533 RepID=J3KVS1_ORYBR
MSAHTSPASQQPPKTQQLESMPPPPHRTFLQSGVKPHSTPHLLLHGVCSLLFIILGG